MDNSQLIHARCTGGDLMAAGSRGNTCLHFAAQKGHATLVRFLIGKLISPTTLVTILGTPDYVYVAMSVCWTLGINLLRCGVNTGATNRDEAYIALGDIASPSLLLPAPSVAT
jgi:hypothetical protein